MQFQTIAHMFASRTVRRNTCRGHIIHCRSPRIPNGEIAKTKAIPCGMAFAFGAPAGIRTPDTLLKRQVLCLLSYWGVFFLPNAKRLSHWKRRKAASVNVVMPARPHDLMASIRRCGWDGGTRTHYIGVKVRCVTITLHPKVSVKKAAAVGRRPFMWGGIWGSNPRHPEPQSGALPTELIPP